MRISYQKVGEPAPTARTVQPLGVAFFDYRWILVAVDPPRRGSKISASPVSMMRTSRANDSKPPAGFSLARHLDGNFGPFTGDGAHTVVIALKGLAASNALEQLQ